MIGNSVAENSIMKITFKNVVFTLIFGALIFGYAFWQGKEAQKAEFELQKTRQGMVKTADKLVDALEETVTEKEGVTLDISYFSEEEYTAVIMAGQRNNLKTELLPILFAILKAENGRPGREFGIMHPRALDTNLYTQAGWAAATVQKNYDRWIKAGSKGDFIAFLGARYCPVGADNDPDGLNKNWIPNVTKWVEKIRG